MSKIIKPLATEIAFTAANNVNEATYVRVYAAANADVTLANTGGTIGTFTMPGGTVDFVTKKSTDTLAGDTSIACTKIAFRS